MFQTVNKTLIIIELYKNYFIIGRQVSHADTHINLLKPTGYFMHQKLKFQQLYALPTLYLCVLYLSENDSDLCHLQHKLVGFYNRDEKCLLCGRDWVFK